MTKSQAAAARRIALKVLRANEETKYFVYGTQFNTTPGSLQSYNLFYHGVTRGVGNNQLLGDKLRWKGIAIKYKIYNGKYDISGYTWDGQPVVIDMYLLRVANYKTTTNLGISDIANDTSGDLSLMFMNPDTKVLKKKTIKIKPDRGQAAAQQVVTSGKIWLKRNQIIQYEDFENNYNLKNGINYYLVIADRSQNGSKQSEVTFAYQNYFTDS